MSVQSLEQRLADLLRLREAVDAELRRVDAAISAQPRRRRSRAEVPPCGTEQGYQWHRTRGQDADEDCLDAHAAHARGRELLRRLRAAS